MDKLTAIRWFQTYRRRDGKESEAVLQCWDDEAKLWKDVPLVRVSEDETQEAHKIKYYLGW